MLRNRNPSLLQGVPPHRGLPAKATVVAMRLSLSCTLLLVLCLGFSSLLCGALDRDPPPPSYAPSGTPGGSDRAATSSAGDENRSVPRFSTDPVRAGETCLVCGRPADAGDAALIYEGRRVVLHRGECLRRFTERPDAHFAPLRPRGALFQESAGGPSG